MPTSFLLSQLPLLPPPEFVVGVMHSFEQADEEADLRNHPIRELLTKYREIILFALIPLKVGLRSLPGGPGFTDL